MQQTIKTYLQPSFLICVLVLASAAGVMSLAVKYFGIHLKKEPLPLKKSLNLLDENDLSPYKVIAKQKIENEEVLQSLGTEDYLQWVLENTDLPYDSPVKRCLLFITYYKLPDRVPHVPEECYTGGGYQKAGSDNIVLKINEQGLEREIKGKYLVFAGMNNTGWQESSELPVLYLFKVNGKYAASRQDARIILGKNIFRNQAYFCKIEVVFNQHSVAPGKELAVSECQKLLSVILPVLEKQHWPDWKKV